MRRRSSTFEKDGARDQALARRLAEKLSALPNMASWRAGKGSETWGLQLRLLQIAELMSRFYGFMGAYFYGEHVRHSSELVSGKARWRKVGHWLLQLFISNSPSFLVAPYSPSSICQTRFQRLVQDRLSVVLFRAFSLDVLYYSVAVLHFSLHTHNPRQHAFKNHSQRRRSVKRCLCPG